jgi:hypothetical protein
MAVLFSQLLKTFHEMSVKSKFLHNKEKCVLSYSFPKVRGVEGEGVQKYHSFL